VCSSDLSDYVEKNKYVVIDFWASWCIYCIADMPNIIETYKQYKDKGFEIVGISLDKTRDPWMKSIKDLGITWPQMSELKFWDAEAVKLYGVAALPHMILISQDGTIVARGFDGKELGYMLKEYLK
jgi:thiol-disulfide isomerase/thioredoxin